MSPRSWPAMQRPAHAMSIHLLGAAGMDTARAMQSTQMTCTACKSGCCSPRTMENRVPVASRKSTYRNVISACNTPQHVFRHTAQPACPRVRRCMQGAAVRQGLTLLATMTMAVAARTSQACPSARPPKSSLPAVKEALGAATTWTTAAGCYAMQPGLPGT
jgi:hypothetical protein